MFEPLRQMPYVNKYINESAAGLSGWHGLEINVSDNNVWFKIMLIISHEWCDA